MKGVNTEWISGEEVSGQSRLATAAVTTDDLVEYVDGVADPATVRRVLAAALQDTAVRSHIAALRALDQSASDFAASHAAERKESDIRLASAMHRMVHEVAAEASVAPEAVVVREEMAQQQSSILTEMKSLLSTEGRGVGGGLWARSAEAVQAFLASVNEAGARALIAGRHALSLPCLAPAMAASTSEFQLRRETITTADGVRIEFQQLPGMGPSRLRVLIDASLLTYELRDLGYNVAFLTLEDGGTAPDLSEAGGEVGEVTPPDRHILVVALNGEGRGFTDFMVGSGGQMPQSVLPAPRGICRLTGITLSRLAS